MEATATEQVQRFAVIVSAAFFGSITAFIAWRMGFFIRLPHLEGRGVSRGWKRVLIAFSLFLGIMILGGTVFSQLVTKVLSNIGAEASSIDGEGTVTAKVSDAVVTGWTNILFILSCFAIFMGYLLILDPVDRKEVWGMNRMGKNPLHHFSVGVISWFLIYPWVLVIGQIVAGITELFTTLPAQDQAAVTHLKEIQGHPFLFAIMVFSIFTLVPIIEELLFRGFLQSWFRQMWGAVKGIMATSAIFALFHFSSSQGITNIEFLASLFVLSCFMGYLKERQDSLWASIGLHSAFNMASLVMLFAVEGV